MPSLVYLTTRSHEQIVSDLTLAGYEVWEALSVSEVLYLCEHHDVDAIVIAAGVEDPELVEVQMRRTTLCLRANTTAANLIWELQQLFPSQNPPIQ